MSYRYKYNRTLVSFAQSNRKSQTNAERLLWWHLRNRQLKRLKFRRQYPIRNYVLDFYCPEKNLAIELDGSQHTARKQYDDKRANDLNKLGIKTVRFWDNDVLLNIYGVIEEIVNVLDGKFENVTLPSPKRRGA